jgi:hypothetical protein
LTPQSLSLLNARRRVDGLSQTLSQTFQCPVTAGEFGNEDMHYPGHLARALVSTVDVPQSRQKPILKIGEGNLAPQMLGDALPYRLSEFWHRNNPSRTPPEKRRAPPLSLPAFIGGKHLPPPP